MMNGRFSNRRIMPNLAAPMQFVPPQARAGGVTLPGAPSLPDVRVPERQGLNPLQMMQAGSMLADTLGPVFADDPGVTSDGDGPLTGASNVPAIDPAKFGNVGGPLSGAAGVPSINPAQFGGASPFPGAGNPNIPGLLGNTLAVPIGVAPQTVGGATMMPNWMQSLGMLRF